MNVFQRTLTPILVLVAVLFISTAQAYSQICRCDCGTNYKIIELPDEGLSYSAACTNCTKKFCLSQNLTICEGVDEMLVSSSCFQRESLKEQFFVYIFIIVTSGLLLYATVFPLIQDKFDFFGRFRRRS